MSRNNNSNILSLCWARRKKAASVWDTWSFIYSINKSNSNGFRHSIHGQEFALGRCPLDFCFTVLIFACECVCKGYSECFLNHVISQDQKISSENQNFFGPQIIFLLFLKWRRQMLASFAKIFQSFYKHCFNILNLLLIKLPLVILDSLRSSKREHDFMSS